MKPLPDNWDSNGSPFQRLLIIRALSSPSALYEEFLEYIRKTLGDMFLQPLALNVENVFAESSSSTPVLFLLSEHSFNTCTVLSKVAYSQGMRDRFHVVSCEETRHDEEENIIELVKSAVSDGYWVLIQECHLAPHRLIEVFTLVISV